MHTVAETLIAGKRLVEEVFVARERRSAAAVQAALERARAPVSRVSHSDITVIAGTPHHQGVAARVGPFPYVEEDDLASGGGRGDMLLLLDEIQDPANLGSILRSAECFGVRGVILGKDRSAAITPAVEKASAGASAHIGVTRVTNLVRTMTKLKKAAYWIFAADVRGGKPWHMADFTSNVVLVLGSEGKGLRRLVRDNCDMAVSIPMTGRIDSLNVAQTAAVLLGEACRQRLVKQSAS
jgi:23S rRNA (guanosine2251-2'-O)-methyltransferase